MNGNIGQALKDLRLKGKMSMKEQGEAFGVSGNTVFRWEKGISSPRKPKAEQIAEYYGISVEALLAGEINKAVIPKKKAAAKSKRKNAKKKKDGTAVKDSQTVTPSEKDETGEAMTLGQKLKELRVRGNKTLKEQSGIFGVSVNSLSNWEKDKTIPRKSKLEHIAAHYGIPVDFLQSDKTETEKAQKETDENDTPVNENENVNVEIDPEQMLFDIIRKLPKYSQHRLLGYCEKLYLESVSGK